MMASWKSFSITYTISVMPGSIYIFIMLMGPVFLHYCMSNDFLTDAQCDGFSISQSRQVESQCPDFPF